MENLPDVSKLSVSDSPGSASTPSYFLPRETTLQIIESMSYEDAADDEKMKALFGIGGDRPMPQAIRHWIEMRCDPRRYMRRLMADVDSLMHVMALTKTFLSGSRAAEFFCPGVIGKDSDWDFYCAGSRLQSVSLYLFFVDKGYSLVAPKSEVERDAGSHPDVPGVDGGYRKEFRVITMKDNSGSGHTVQLIHARCASPLDVVLTFHSSIVQCYITSTVAVSAVSALTRVKRSIRYLAEDGDLERDRARCIDKYKSRGVAYLAYDERYAPVSPNTRSLPDEHSTVVPIEGGYPDLPPEMMSRSSDRLDTTVMSWKNIRTDPLSGDATFECRGPSAHPYMLEFTGGEPIEGLGGELSREDAEYAKRRVITELSEYVKEKGRDARVSLGAGEDGAPQSISLTVPDEVIEWSEMRQRLEQE